jgi:hypothetical protein
MTHDEAGGGLLAFISEARLMRLKLTEPFDVYVRLISFRRLQYVLQTCSSLSFAPFPFAFCP